MHSLDERLAELRGRAAERAADAAMCRRKAGDFEHEAMVLEAEIRGIEEAREALAAMAALDVPLDIRPRSPKRDIKALVRAELSEPRPEGSQPSPEAIALRIGCRPSQVRKAIEGLRWERDVAG